MPNKPAPFTHGRLTRWQALYLTLCLVLSISTGVIGYVAVTTSQETHRAQCSAKGTLEDNLKGSKEFLDHPEKFPKFNEPAIIKLTLAQVESEEDRLDALKDVNC